MGCRTTLPRFGGSLFFLLLCALGGWGGESILERGEPRTFTVHVEYTLRVVGGTPGELWLSMPMPETNIYQDVALLGDPPGEIRAYPETGGRYYYIHLVGKDFKKGPPYVGRHSFRVTTYRITAGFAKAPAIRPHDPASPEYRRYTGPSGSYIVPDNPEIALMAAELDQAARNDLEYARLAYDMVAERYRFLKSDVDGLLPLARVLRRKGGACGNLSSIYISLLRRRGIPARHLVGYQPDGNPHVLADFHLQGLGWIPVDVTGRITRPDLDFFGTLDNRMPTIILSKGADLTIPGPGGPIKRNAMQSGYFWWKNSSGTTKRVEVESYSFTCVEETETPARK